LWFYEETLSSAERTQFALTATSVSEITLAAMPQIMNVEKNITIQHSVRDFSKRRNYYILIWIGILSIFGLFSLGKDQRTAITLMVAFSFASIFYFVVKIYRTRLYLADFDSDSKEINIRYFNGNSECFAKTDMENIEVYLKNTSSRSGFDCELHIHLNELSFFIDKNFDWNYKEMGELFQYITYHKQEIPSENEKNTLERLKLKY